MLLLTSVVSNPGEGVGSGQRAALSTGCAGARQRIVRMPTALPAGAVVVASAGACGCPPEQRPTSLAQFLGGLHIG